MLELHKISVIIWLVVFGLHVLAHLPRVTRAPTTGRTAARGDVRGSAFRAMLVAIATAAGAALAIPLLPTIQSWPP